MKTCVTRQVTLRISENFRLAKFVQEISRWSAAPEEGVAAVSEDELTAQLRYSLRSRCAERRPGLEPEPRPAREIRTAVEINIDETESRFFKERIKARFLCTCSLLVSCVSSSFHWVKRTQNYMCEVGTLLWELKCAMCTFEAKLTRATSTAKPKALT